jgi:hypothetical protein
MDRSNDAMTDDNQGMIERELTPSEIEERNKLNLDLQGKRDDNLAEINEKRRQIRMLNVSNKRLELRSAEIRREIRTGKVFESRQGVLALELAPAEPVDRNSFAGRYPLARDAVQLQGQLAVVLQGVLTPSIAKLERWQPSTAGFQELAHWARVELAYMNLTEHPALQIPSRMPMPKHLAALRGEIARAVKDFKKASKKAHKSNVSPASGAPVRVSKATTRSAGARRKPR